MVLFDHRVHQDILALIPPQTEQISLAEQPLQIDRIIQNRVESGGEVAVLAYSTSVAATKKMVNRLIKQGIRVERLDSGTPYY
jgi:siroheme synthase